MRTVKDIISSIENRFKSRSRRGYQAITRSFAQLRGRVGTHTRSIFRNTPRSRGGGQR